MSSLSKIKIVQSEKDFPISDKKAIKKIYFNGKEYLPNGNGEVNFTDDYIKAVQDADIIQKNIINYNDDVSVYKNGLYVVKERSNEKFSNYSMFLYDNDKLIQLSTPTALFETDDIDFFTLLKSEYKKYLYWDLLYNANIFTTKKKVRGIDVFGDEIDGYKVVYFCLKDFDESTYEIAPYIVYKQTVGDETFLVKQYVKQEQPDGTLEFIEGKATKCSNKEPLKTRNGFARSVEKK